MNSCRGRTDGDGARVAWLAAALRVHDRAIEHDGEAALLALQRLDGGNLRGAFALEWKTEEGGARGGEVLRERTRLEQQVGGAGRRERGREREKRERGSETATHTHTHSHTLTRIPTKRLQNSSLHSSVCFQEPRRKVELYKAAEQKERVEVRDGAPPSAHQVSVAVVKTFSRRHCSRWRERASERERKRTRTRTRTRKKVRK